MSHAIQFVSREGIGEELDLGFLGDGSGRGIDWLLEALTDDEVELSAFGKALVVKTPDGPQPIRIGDYIVQGDDGLIRVRRG